MLNWATDPNRLGRYRYSVTAKVPDNVVHHMLAVQLFGLFPAQQNPAIQYCCTVFTVQVINRPHMGGLENTDGGLLSGPGGMGHRRRPETAHQY